MLRPFKVWIHSSGGQSTGWRRDRGFLEGTWPKFSSNFPFQFLCNCAFLCYPKSNTRGMFMGNVRNGKQEFSNISLVGATNFTFHKCMLCSEKTSAMGMKSWLFWGWTSSAHIKRADVQRIIWSRVLAGRGFLNVSFTVFTLVWNRCVRLAALFSQIPPIFRDLSIPPANVLLERLGRNITPTKSLMKAWLYQITEVWMALSLQALPAVITEKNPRQQFRLPLPLAVLLTPVGEGSRAVAARQAWSGRDGALGHVRFFPSGTPPPPIFGRNVIWLKN